MKLGTNYLERWAKDGDKTEKSQSNRGYKKLDKFWHKQKKKLVTCDRIDSFWFPQRWWGEVIKSISIWEFIKTDIEGIFKGLKNWHLMKRFWDLLLNIFQLRSSTHYFGRRNVAQYFRTA